MSQSVLFITILIVFIILIATVLKWTSEKSAPPLTYEKNFSLLSATEKAFLTTLEPLLGDRYRIFAKPRLADLVQIHPPRGQNLSAETRARINATTVSFVLCSAKDFSIAGIINLENKSNPADTAEMPDDFIDNAAAEAGLPNVRLPSRLQYDADEIATLLENNIELPEQLDSKPAANKYGDCPSCGEPLMLLKAKQGENIGKYFLGCSNYPECKYLSMLNDTEAGHEVAAAPQPEDESATTGAEKQA